MGYTSPIAKGLFSKWNWQFSNEAKIYVDTNIKPAQIGFYGINISSNEGYLRTKYLLIGQTLSGEILSDEKCQEYLNMFFVISASKAI